MQNYRKRCLDAKGEECLICGSEDSVVVHHVDSDRENNDSENLIPVCRSHHTRIHLGDDDLAEYVEPLPDSALIDRETVAQGTNERGLSADGWTELTKRPAAAKLLHALLDAQGMDLNKSDLAEMADVGRRTVHNNIDLLVDLGLVEETRTTGGAQMYALQDAEDAPAVKAFVHFHDALAN